MSDGEPAAVEAPENHAHAHAHHGTGVRWLDISLGLAALFTSVVSLWVAVQHGRDMQRLVAANSLPFVGIYRSDFEADRTTPALRFSVENEGVGPARIADVAVSLNGRAIPNLPTLLDRCCAPGLLNAPESAKSFDGIADGDLAVEHITDRMIRPGQSVDMIAWHRTAANGAAMDRLRRAMAAGQLRIRLCYCSVFDECWVRGDRDPRPEPVDECPADPTPYRQ